MKYASVQNGAVVCVLRVHPSTIYAGNYAETFIEAPEDVEAFWLWDGVKFTKPAVDIESLREAKNSEINAARLAATFSTFDYSGKTISSDQLSRSDIDGINGYVSLNGIFPAVFPGAWKCADNSYVPIQSVDEWRGFYGAMVAAGSAHFAHSEALKAALAVATTAEQIAAVAW